MHHTPFVGREKELTTLTHLLAKKTASLVVIKGRRRIGKSRLVEEFAKHKRFYHFTGLPPTEKTTAQSQKDEFSKQLSEQLQLPEIKADDWSTLFVFLAKALPSERVIILFDEITWMGSKDPDFLGKLKNAWDLHFSKNPQLILFLCGSISSWIETNIIKSTGFFGRISQQITLKELPLKDCYQLLDRIGFKRSSLEKLLILSIIGGIPWYIEQITPDLSAIDNIHRLCFTETGLLVHEFKYIFHDLFGKRKDICADIVRILAKGSLERKAILSELGYPLGGTINSYLDDLLISGFIQQHFVWDFKTGKPKRLSQYRLSDNYLRFYLKYIEPKRLNIEKGQYEAINITTLPGWDAIIGLQFEHLILNNRPLIWQALGIRPEEIINDNPFFQHTTEQQQGCQIDYLIQTKYNTLFACEIKFTRRELKPSLITAMQEKIARLKLPRGFSCFPVLIVAGELQDTIIEANYFTKIIDINALINPIGVLT